MNSLIKSGKKLTVTGKKWFDSRNGNTYFRCHIQLNDDTLVMLPFQYGYGDHYVDVANDWLDENGYIDSPKRDYGGRKTLWRYCNKNNIDFNYYSYEVKTRKQCESDFF